MKWWAVIFGFGLSIVVHAVFAAGIFSIPKNVGRRATTVTVFEAKRDKKKPQDEDKPKEDKPPPPPKPITAPKPILKAPEPPTENTPPPAPNASPTPPGHAAMAALPDFGISLGGGVSGGIAVPQGGGSGAGGQRGGGAGGGEKKVRALAPKPSAAEIEQVEPDVKAQPVGRVQPVYPDEARAAGIEGPVRVEITINEQGEVVEARVDKGLGHGLDEAALTAAKRMKFSPAMKAGKPIRTKRFIIIRFQLGD